MRTLLAAKIVINDGASAFDCTVRTISDVGALLQMGGAAAVPDDIVVVIGNDATAQSRRAHVVRRQAFGLVSSSRIESPRGAILRPILSNDAALTRCWR